MEILLSKLLKIKWIKECLFFLTLFAIYSLGDYESISSSKENFIHEACFYTILYIHAMLHRFWLFPLLFDKKQKGIYLLWSLFFLLVFSTTSFFIQTTILKFDEQILIEEISRLQNELATGEHTSFWDNLGTNILCVIFMSSIYFIIRYFDQEKKEANFQLLINQLEINQLREQLSPHFMFNTLNNLYGISLEQPERTPDMIMKLSQMMRYQIEASRKERVSLTEEIEFIESYIAIENERVNNRCTVHFDGKIGQTDLEIAPILLLPFIENAFKHGTATAQKSFINITIELLKKSQLEHLNTISNKTTKELTKEEAPSFLSLKIENSIPQKKKNIASTGFGLENVQQRLLRLYALKHTLRILPTTSTFFVHLEINLQA